MYTLHTNEKSKSKVLMGFIKILEKTSKYLPLIGDGSKIKQQHCQIIDIKLIYDFIKLIYMNFVH